MVNGGSSVSEHDQEESSTQVSACIDDVDGVGPRCCDSVSTGCTLQGFGRQVVWVDNKGDGKVVIKLTTKNLIGLTRNEFVNIVGRESNVFKLPSVGGVFRVDSDGAVEYLVGSPVSSDATKVVKGDVPIDAMIGTGKKSIYATITGGTRARLVERSPLLLNHWNEQKLWNHVASDSSGIALLDHSVIRVESCDMDAQSSDLTLDGKPVSLSDGGYVDLPVKEGMDVNVDGSGRFRVGLIQNSRIVSYNLGLSSMARFTRLRRSYSLKRECASFRGLWGDTTNHILLISVCSIIWLATIKCPI
jgi:hypothetical protein